MSGRGVPVPCSVTVPEIEPPTARAALMLGVLAPAVTETRSAEAKSVLSLYHSVIWVPGKPQSKNATL